MNDELYSERARLRAEGQRLQAEGRELQNCAVVLIEELRAENAELKATVARQDAKIETLRKLRD